MNRTRWIFLRVLGGIYLVAFLSLWTQIGGLIGSHGILPVENLMHLARETIPWRFDLFPTLLWFSESDRFLNFLCGGGVLLSLVAIVGVAEPVVFFLLWLIYLSLAVGSQEFLSYQWDGLLLEAGFLAIFFAPFEWRPRLASATRPPTLTLWLYRWLLIRLVFESAAAKYLGGDPAWRGLTALSYYFETQPLPTWVGWYAYHLPGWVLQGGVVMMFAIEVAAPWLIAFSFFWRRARLWAAFLVIFLQVLITLTGNYGFFNLLTVALCLLLLDDDFFARRSSSLALGEVPAVRKLPTARFANLVVAPLAALILFVSTTHLVWIIFNKETLFMPLRRVERLIRPFATINRYGLFAVITKERREIVVEGSYDGVEWKTYEFKDKPGDPNHRPGFVAPHQPRLDWQMWFAAQGICRENPWIARFLRQLMRDSSPVLGLIAYNPFPEAPPKYLRTSLYRYQFTHLDTRRGEGTWWRREFIGPYCPVLSKHRPTVGLEEKN